MEKHDISAQTYLIGVLGEYVSDLSGAHRCPARDHLALEVFYEKQRATETREEHDEERDHGRDEKGVQTSAAGTRSGLTLDICGHIQKRCCYPAAARGDYIHESSRLSEGRHHEQRGYKVLSIGRN